MKKNKNHLLIAMIIFTVIFFMNAYEVFAGDSNKVVTVVLDPGHGGSDGGASRTYDGTLYAEREINLKIAQYCKAELEEYYGVDVYLTRTNNHTKLGLTERVEYAQSKNADYLISIHCNASTNTYASGSEVYVPNKNYNNNRIYERSQDLAKTILEELSKLGLKKRGVYTNNSTINEHYPDGSLADYYAVIRESKIRSFPGLIVEHAFISNYSDVISFLKTEESLKKLGVADATAIAQYLNLSKDNGLKKGEDGEWYYYENGVVNAEFTGLVKKGGEMWLVQNGKVDFSYNGWFSDESGAWFIENGVTDCAFTGLKMCGDLLYYFRNGILDSGYNNLASYEGNWYYVKDGTIDFDFTGLVQYYKTWYYVENGLLDWTYSGIVLHYSTWYYVEDGVLNWDYTGYVEKDGEEWYVEEGVVVFDRQGLWNSNGEWYYFKDGKIDYSFSSLIKYYGTWYYVKEGKIDWSYDDVVEYYGTWYYVEDGVLNWNYTGIVDKNDETWYIDQGVANFSKNELVKSNGEWYYLKDGKVDYSYSNLIKYYRTWYYVRDGKIDWTYTGIVLYYSTLYYVEDGMLDWNYTGVVVQNGEKFVVVDGIATKDVSDSQVEKDDLVQENDSIQKDDIVKDEDSTQKEVTLFQQLYTYYTDNAIYPEVLGDTDAPDVTSFINIYVEECALAEIETENISTIFGQFMEKYNFLQENIEIELLEDNTFLINVIEDEGVVLKFENVREMIRSYVCCM